MSILERLRRLPLLGILRGVREESIGALTELCVDCGLPALEITLNTDEVLPKLRRLVNAAGDRLAVGAGTVLDAEGARAAVEAGAGFLVSPGFFPDVAHAARQYGVPYFPGAFTPTEVGVAARAGAAMVKLFPAGVLGPAYVKELRGPYASVPLLVCGGVKPENVVAYRAAGATAFAVGDSVFARTELARGDLSGVRERLAALIAALRAAEVAS
jgi:2-dehydro-3-deoxyphosphogluconate aldolase/(4S)-4-hydroxy-2-oxoglutarate aldolase